MSRNIFDVFLILISFYLSFLLLRRLFSIFIFKASSFVFEVVSLPQDSGGWLYEYQTLIAGILAIAAAVYGGSCVLKAARYPHNLDAISEANRYKLDLMGTAGFLSLEINKIKNNKFDQQYFFRQWSLKFSNVQEMKPSTVELLGLTGAFLKFRFFVGDANAMIEALRNGSLSLPKDQGVIVMHLKRFKEELFSCVKIISKQTKDRI